MRQYDLSPFYKTTIGFDRLASLLDDLNGRAGDVPNYPPYNIVRVDEHNYRLSMAVAGFSDDDLSMEVHDNVLTVRAETQAATEEVEYLHRGIAARNFERQFSLEDFVQVEGAFLENGLLHIDLFRELPEARKPRKIRIGSAPTRPVMIDEPARKTGLEDGTKTVPVAAE